MTNTRKEILQHHLCSHFSLSKEEADGIASYFQFMVVTREQSILREREKASAIYFITQGIVRSHWSDKQGNDITNFFFKENQFVTGLDSYLSGKPSPIGIRTVTDCELLFIQKRDEQNLREEIPVWSSLFGEFVRQSLMDKVGDVNRRKSVKAKEQYKDFVSTNGDLARRVPLQYIASYLGITPQTLSRIRRSYT